MNQYEKAKKAVKHLKDDNNDGHKLYAIAECLLALTEQAIRIADVFDPPQPPSILCYKCGVDLSLASQYCHADGEEPSCYGGCRKDIDNA
jgi:hypothetical protein